MQEEPIKPEEQTGEEPVATEEEAEKKAEETPA